MKATIRYGILKALPLAAKAVLLALSPRILYATVQPSAANGIIFLLSTLGYISLLSPGRDLLAIQRFNSHRLYKNSLPKTSTITALAKYVYLLFFPSLFYLLAIYGLVDTPVASLLLLFICLVSIIDNYFLPYKAEAHICANPEKAYLLQSLFSVPSTILLVYSSLNVKSSAALWFLFCAFIIYFLGQLISSLYFRSMVLASLKVQSRVEKLSNKDLNVSTSSKYEVRVENAYIRLAPVLTMLTFGMLPYYYYFSANQSSYQQLMTFYPMFILPSTALGSLYFTRMHAGMRLHYHETGLEKIKPYSVRLLLTLSSLNTIGSLVVLFLLRLTSANFDISLFPFFALMAALNAPLVVLPSLLLSIDQASVLVKALMITMSISLMANIFFWLVTPDLSLFLYLSFMCFLLVAFPLVALCLLRRRMRGSARVNSRLSFQ